jgi:hypothetical protein
MVVSKMRLFEKIVSAVHTAVEKVAKAVQAVRAKVAEAVLTIAIRAIGVAPALDRRGNVGNIGALILGLVVSMITIFIAELLGGVLSSQITSLYTTFNLTNTVWQSLFTQTQTIATSAIQVAIVGFLIAAFMVVIGIFAFRRGK